MGIIFFNSFLQKFYSGYVAPFSQLPPKMFVSRISYDMSTLPQCILNEGLDAIMRCRRCCIDNMFRILNNDSEAVLRGITKQRTLECASRRVRTLEKSIWTRGTRCWVPSLLLDIIMNALLSIPCYRLFVPLLSPPTTPFSSSSTDCETPLFATPRCSTTKWFVLA